MITIEGVSKVFNNEYIFKDVSFTLNSNDKVALVGRNGVGKTTLLKILQDDMYATDGCVKYGKEKVAFLDQEKQLDKNKTLIQEMDTLKKELTNLKNKIEEISNHKDFAKDDQLIFEYGELEQKYVQLGGYEIDLKIKKMLYIFGFSSEVFDKKIKDFSGGERTRIALLKIVLGQPDFLILDEPTNHLDIKTIEWLEEYLRIHIKGMLIISHDRFFLERVCNKVIELENQGINEYNMKYSKFEVEKKNRVEYLKNTYENQIKQIKEYEEFIIKNNGKPNKIGQVNDRKKKIEMIELVEVPDVKDEKISFSIEGLKLKKAPYIELMDVIIGNEEGIIKEVNLKINGGDRLGIVGENGAGKSTLIKTMTKQISAISGRVIVHPKIKIGYFDQMQEELDLNKNVYNSVEELMPNETKTMIRKHLANFLFKRDDIFKKVSVLSGGEKVRLCFAMFVLQRYDLLILDEPTNHLDMSAKEELEEVLKQYQGTLILISHDRYFMNQIISTVAYITEQKLLVHDGSYDEFILTKHTEKVEKKKKEKEVKNQSKLSNNKINQLEKEINHLEEEKLKIEETCQEKYEDWEYIKKAQMRLEEIENKIDDIYETLL